MGHRVMVLVAWFPSGPALYIHHECTLSQVGTRPDMTLDVARKWHRTATMTEPLLLISEV